MASSKDKHPPGDEDLSCGPLPASIMTPITNAFENSKQTKDDLDRLIKKVSKATLDEQMTKVSRIIECSLDIVSVKLHPKCTK